MKDINFPAEARPLEVLNFRSLLPPELADKLNLDVEEIPKIDEEEEKQSTDPERGGLVGQMNKLNVHNSEDQGSVITTQTGTNSQFDIPEDEEGRIQSSGHKDETCIEESPEMKDISRVNKMMEKQNEKSVKAFVNVNPSSIA